MYSTLRRSAGHTASTASRRIGTPGGESAGRDRGLLPVERADRRRGRRRKLVEDRRPHPVHGVPREGRVAPVGHEHGRGRWAAPDTAELQARAALAGELRPVPRSRSGSREAIRAPVPRGRTGDAGPAGCRPGRARAPRSARAIAARSARPCRGAPRGLRAPRGPGRIAPRCRARRRTRTRPPPRAQPRAPRPTGRAPPRGCNRPRRPLRPRAPCVGSACRPARRPRSVPAAKRAPACGASTRSRRACPRTRGAPAPPRPPASDGPPATRPRRGG